MPPVPSSSRRALNERLLTSAGAPLAAPAKADWREEPGRGARTPFRAFQGSSDPFATLETWPLHRERGSRVTETAAGSHLSPAPQCGHHGHLCLSFGGTQGLGDGHQCSQTGTGGD